jgi:ubiquinone/menaquinone biosynthesis C-methylase UbiE
MKTELYQKENAKIFYEDRYTKGYMDDWPAEKKQKVFEIIKNLPLPETGIALDFGCGTGVFTNVLQQALPNWEIYGCDISRNSINNAKIRFPDCNFFISDNDQTSDIKFDFLFSHHVLEHVFDIQQTISEINNYLKPISFSMLIFPCGNEGSLEYKVCSIRTDGINIAMENRFFYEDEGHIRRLTTDQTNKLMGTFGFTLKKDFYRNQYYGAVKWISQTSPQFILKFTDVNTIKDKQSIKFLLGLRYKLLLLNIVQLSAIFFFTRIKIVREKKIQHYIFAIVNFIPFLISYPFYYIINYRAEKEWINNKDKKNGSEMYLFYSRK